MASPSTGLRTPLPPRFQTWVQIIVVLTGCREHPLPAPLLTGIRIFALQGIRKAHAPQALLQVHLMPALHGLQVSQERVLRSRRAQEGGQSPCRPLTLTALPRWGEGLVLAPTRPGKQWPAPHGRREWSCAMRMKRREWASPAHAELGALHPMRRCHSAGSRAV
jgi:hypothetical protein